MQVVFHLLKKYLKRPVRFQYPFSGWLKGWIQTLRAPRIMKTTIVMQPFLRTKYLTVIYPKNNQRSLARKRTPMVILPLQRTKHKVLFHPNKVPMSCRLVQSIATIRRKQADLAGATGLTDRWTSTTTIAYTYVHRTAPTSTAHAAGHPHPQNPPGLSGLSHTAPPTNPKTRTSLSLSDSLLNHGSRNGN